MRLMRFVNVTEQRTHIVCGFEELTIRSRQLTTCYKPDSATFQGRLTSVARSFSRTVSNRASSFREQVRRRDAKCVVTGLINPAAYRPGGTAFEAPIILLSLEELFIGLNYPHNSRNRSSLTHVE
ncbi:hypothetical protein LIPSTDRAFT_192444 [Lipomyces starkeyi NRRL Y-11557]|uniref:Uncharacterized protein n=1 Tax=Lipomyces starkeyi NRRL Y-11557 TaxID=675824 RepID=A0A1E3PXV2_LIPST|nr:hypothetical protein LIPSTDRAFT_192444 [Lipomyces starkeyi NRRL Y-11557]